MKINWKAALIGTLVLCVASWLAISFVALELNPLAWRIDFRVVYIGIVFALSLSAFIIVYLEPRQ